MLRRRQLLAAMIAAPLLGRAGAAMPRRLAMPAPALWDPKLPWREGFAPGPYGPVGWRFYPGGPPGAVPAIILHGGPAAGHRYLRAYAALAHDRPVLFYDQGGCGRSAAPADLSLYTADRYVDELEAVRRALGFERVNLVGHSWGAFLAPLYANRHPERVNTMVLAGGASRWRDFQLASDRWLAALGPHAVATARRAEALGRTDDPAYLAVMGRYYARHLCRLDPIPAWFAAEGEKLARNPVYNSLNGPSEFQMTGRFATLDLRPILPRLPMPTLVTCGEFDEGPVWVAAITTRLLPHARLDVFEGLSHMSHIEAPRTVTDRTAAFLREADNSRRLRDGHLTLPRHGSLGQR